MIRKLFNLFIILILIFFLLLPTGCVSNKFDIVPPPVKEFPTAIPYEEVAVISETFIIEKSFRGNKGTNCLTTSSDAQTIKGFSVGEKGVVSYEYRGNTYKFDAVISACPTEGAGLFVASYNDTLNVIPESFPGKFSVITYQEDNCLQVSKSAVLQIDEEGNAIVLQIDSNGLLFEKSIVVSLSNDTHFKVVEGLKNGDKVVIR